MKRFLLLTAFGIECVIGGSREWNEESRRKELAQVTYWESKLIESRSASQHTRIKDLSLGLRNMGYRKSIEGHSAAVDEVYQKIQQDLVAIPGHAQHFANELERLREANSLDYGRLRSMYLAEILQHLPSPETIRVLGGYLSDMRHTPYDENPKFMEALREGRVKHPDWAPTLQNAWLATYALSNIGLKDPPFEALKGYSTLRIAPMNQSLPRFRAWWEEVRIGKRTFSFVGQTVEYRFKADGGWEVVTNEASQDRELGLPDTKPPQATIKPETKPRKERVPKPRVIEAVPVSNESRKQALWKWALGVFLMLIFIIGFWSKMRRT